MSVFHFQASPCSSSTPNRRRSLSRSTNRSRESSSPVFAFSTSPSVLQDITLENTIAMDSPTGLTMKEYDEQLSKLTAENFQLKLKIYFMDMKLAKIKTLTDQDLFRENVDLRVQYEAKSKELIEKQKLLHETSQVVKQLEAEHNQNIFRLKEQADQEKTDLELKLSAMEASLRMLEAAKGVEKDSENRLKELEMQLNEKDVTIEALKKQIGNFEDRRLDYSLKLHQMEEVNVCSNREKSALLLELGKLRAQLEEIKPCSDVNAHESFSDLKLKLLVKEEELNGLTQEHKKACEAITKLVRRAQADREEREKLQKELEELRFKADGDQSRNQDGKCVCEIGKLVEKLEAEIIDLKNGKNQQELEKKEAEIERLRESLSKRTSDLQKLVNKELWSKNKQIEKLERKITDLGKHQLEEEVKRLVALLDDVTADRDQLKKDIGALKEKELPLRQACSALIHRLEELSNFLDTLLTNDCDAHSSLTIDEHRAARRAIELSRDLSRTLTRSLETDGILSEVVFNTVYQDIELSLCKGNQILWSHKVRDNRLKGDDGESESWSEPDRSVSQARMGISEVRLSNSFESSGSEDKVKRGRSMERDLKKYQGKIRALQEANKDLEEKVRCLEKKSELFEELNQCLEDLEEAQKHCKMLKERLSEKDKELGDKDRELNGKIVETREVYEKLESCLMELKEMKESYEKLKQEKVLSEDLIRTELLMKKDGELVEKDQIIKDLEMKLSDLHLEYELKLVETRQQSKDLQHHLQISESRVNDQSHSILELQKQLKDTEQAKSQIKERLLEKERICGELELKLREAETVRLDLVNKVAEVEEKVQDGLRLRVEFAQQVQEAARHVDMAEAARQRSERRAEKLQHFVSTLQEQTERKAVEAEEKSAEADKQLGELRRRLSEAERSKSIVEQKVKESRDRIHWMETKIRELEDVVERCSEEAQSYIDKEIKLGVETRLFEIRNEWMPRSEVERLLAKQNELFDQRLKAVEEQRDRCYEMMKETENELTSKMAGLTEEKEEMRQRLEEVEGEMGKMELQLRQIQKEEYTVRSLPWNRITNTSPDLGIESDQGRFSSLENADPTKMDLIGENEDLRKKVLSLRQMLEATQTELATAHQQKKVMEHAICRQLHKTHHILKKARVNLEDQQSS